MYLFIYLFSVSTYAQLTITSAGHVGIGTATPSNIGGWNQVLDVSGRDHAKVLATTNDGSVRTGLFANSYNGGWGRIGTETNHPFEFITNNLLNMKLYTDGNLKLTSGNKYMIGSYANFMTAATGSFGLANGFDFNTSTTASGVLIESGQSESGGFYADGDFAVIWSPGDQNRLLRVYDEDNMVEKWYLDANGYAYTNSDAKRKENVVDITTDLEKLKKIKGVKYTYKKEQQELNKTNLPNSSIYEGDSIVLDQKPVEENVKYDPSQEEYYGFLAQEVEKIYPELVDTDENGDKYISYMEFIPLLVEALKDQQQQIDELSKNVKLKSNDGLKTAESSEAILGKNKPNPFNEETSIEYYIPVDAQKAILFIYDLTGRQIKSLNIVERENGSVTLYASELQAGMYKYALVVDGELVGSESMILTD